MLSALVFALLAAGPGEGSFRVLFFGNSHTSTNDVPGMVRELLKSGGFECETKGLGGAHLDAFEGREDVLEALEGEWSHAVLQGAMISSSHKYEYPQDKAIALAKRVSAEGSRVLYFAEWPRRGWDESDYIFSHYEAIREAAGGEVVPTCHAWDAALAGDSSLSLWSADGNHAELAGSFLAACTIAYWIGGTEARLVFVPSRLEAGLGSRLRQVAWETVSKARKSRE